jgi:hypothetical protein
MTEGPVPSTIKNYIDANWYWVSEPEGLGSAFSIKRDGLPKLMPGTAEPREDYLSDTDNPSIAEAMEKAHRAHEADRPHGPRPATH